MSTFMLDSGAFSAWNKGAEIDIDHYIAFIKHHAEYIDHYVVLDKIPGAFGVTPSAAEVEESAQQSWDNLLYMQAAGLDPIPVFHMGEQFKWLRRMVDHGCKYIGISPANDRTTQAKRVWLDRVFDEITDKEGWPLVQTHAFGVTAVELLMRYPWYSADSTTWIMIAARGKILLPHYENGQFVYSKTPTILYISEPYGEGETLKRGLLESQWRNVPSEREHVQRWMEHCGSNIDLCAEDYKERTRVCCQFFQEFERNYVPTPFVRKRERLFIDK